MPDYTWWKANGRYVKARLTRAEKLIEADPHRAMAESRAVYVLMDQYGYPDWWARAQRLYDDAYYEARRQGWDGLHERSTREVDV